MKPVTKLDALRAAAIVIRPRGKQIQSRPPRDASLPGIAEEGADIPQLHFDFRFRRNLLEQPSPFFHLPGHVDGAILWTNLHLLFWLSLIPFATAWPGADGSAPVPTAIYGVRCPS